MKFNMPVEMPPPPPKRNLKFDLAAIRRSPFTIRTTFCARTIIQESLADAKVSARQQCVYEDP